MIQYKANQGELKVGDRILILLSCVNCGYPVGARYINKDNSIIDEVEKHWNFCPFCGISKNDWIE
jgi:hypothetical protein